MSSKRGLSETASHCVCSCCRPVELARISYNLVLVMSYFVQRNVMLDCKRLHGCTTGAT